MNIKRFTLNEIVHTCDGLFYGDKELLKKETSQIVYYLSDIKENTEVFFENKETTEAAIVDMKAAYKKGVICCVTDKKWIYSPEPCIYVSNRKVAAIRIAEIFRKHIHIPIIAVTGSVGKTSTKDMCISVLSQEYHPLKTRDTDNTVHHLAFGLLGLREHHNVAVLEAAIGRKEDMLVNGRITYPDIVIMTCIGTSHLIHHNTEEKIFVAKSQILDYMSPIGMAYVNGCDKFLKTISLDKPRKVKMFGMNDDMEYHPENINNLGLKGVNCDLVYKKDRLNVTIPVPGLHFINAALAAFAVGLDFGLSLESIKKGIEGFKSSGPRTKVINTEFITIIEDCHNAPPPAVKANIDMLSELEGRKVFVMGDMGELGIHTQHYHKEIGKHIAEKGINLLIYAGQYAEYVVNGIKSNGGKCEVICCEKKENLLDIFPNTIQKNDIVLVKAGHESHFETVTKMLMILK